MVGGGPAVTDEQQVVPHEVHVVALAEAGVEFNAKLPKLCGT